MGPFSPKISTLLRYMLVVSLAALLGYLAFRNLTVVDGESKADLLLQVWARANKYDLGAVALLSVLSHLLRAARWSDLLASAGHSARVWRSFLALMVGYLVNIAVPRGGEVARCYSLLNMEQTPISTSLGTVVAERAVDVVCLGLLVSLSALLEWSKLPDIALSLGALLGIKGLLFYAMLATGALLLVALAAYLLRNHPTLLRFATSFKEGFLAVLRLRRPLRFVVFSIAIWGVYLAMTYYTMAAFPETESLGFSAAVALLAAGSLAIAIPLPGGVGSYHTLVPAALVFLYAIPSSDAIAVVFIFHAWQTLITLAPGVVCLLISYKITGKEKQNQPEQADHV